MVSQREWARKNPDYFKGRYEAVKCWREKHPDYRRQWWEKRRKTQAQGIQDSVVSKTVRKSIGLTIPVGVFEGIQDLVCLDLPVIIRSYRGVDVSSGVQGGIQDEIEFLRPVVIRHPACDGQRATP